MFTRMALPLYAIPGYGLPEYAIPFGVGSVAWTEPSNCAITADVTMPANTISGDVTITTDTITTGVTMPANTVTGDVGIGCGFQT
jgi:hypothetical protein